MSETISSTQIIISIANVLPTAEKMHKSNLGRDQPKHLYVALLSSNA